MGFEEGAGLEVFVGGEGEYCGGVECGCGFGVDLFVGGEEGG